MTLSGWYDMLFMWSDYFWYVTNNTLLWICTVSKGKDFILTEGDNCFMVIIPALDPFFVVDTDKGVEQVVTDHQCLPALLGGGAFSYGGLK